MNCAHDFAIQPLRRGMALMICGGCCGAYLLLPGDGARGLTWTRYAPEPGDDPRVLLGPALVRMIPSIHLLAVKETSS